MKCDRCGQPTHTWRMSRFNTECCCPLCLAAEEKHPDYAQAAEAELRAVQSGDYNFPGIGKPEDL